MSTATKRQNTIPKNSPMLSPDDAPLHAKRNMGIELFRIVAMCMVVILHLIGFGGIKSATVKFSPQWVAVYVLEAITYCCVDCYAIITGYTNVKSRFRYRRIVYLWLEVFTITVSTTLIAKFIFHIDVTPDEWKNALMPLTSRQLWYFNAYFLLFFFIPILNKGILAMERWQLITSIVSMLFLTTVLTRLGNRDLFVVGSGYSAMWLMILYLIGAYFRIYGFPKSAKWYITLPTFFVSAGIAVLQFIIAQKWIENGVLKEGDWLYQNKSFLISYISPCMVLMATCLLLFFGQLKIRFKISEIIIGNLGKASFGVFAVHVSDMVWNHFMPKRLYKPLGTLPVFQLVVGTILAGIGLYLVCALYSLARIYLFKLLRIHKAVDWVADRIPPRRKPNTEVKKT